MNIPAHPRRLTLMAVGFALLALLLTSCRPEPTLQPVAELPPTATATATLRPTHTPTLTLTPTITLTPTETVRPTSTTRPTRTQTATPTPRQLNVPAVPLPPQPFKAHLRPPDPETLLKALAYSIEEVEHYNVFEGWSPMDSAEFTGNHLRINYLVATDLERYYPDGSGLSEWITKIPREMSNNAATEGFCRFSQKMMLDYLNSKQRTLKDKATQNVGIFQVTPRLVELDNDPEPEWLLEIDSGLYAVSGWLPLDQVGKGSYTIFPNNLPCQRPPDLDLTRDVNGDRRPDWISTSYEYALSSYMGAIRIFSSDGAFLYTLLERPLLVPSWWERDITWEFGEFTGDGVTDLRIHTPRSANFGCTWQHVQTYSFSGSTMHMTETGAKRPDTVECEVSRLLDPNGAVPPGERVGRLEAILPRVDGDRYPDMMALMRVHLGMAYAAIGNERSAAYQFSQAAALPAAQGSYVSLVQAAWSAHPDQPVKACEDLFQGATRSSLDLQTDIRYDLAIGGVMHVWPVGAQVYAPLVCPLRLYAQDRVTGIRPASGALPQDMLAANALSASQMRLIDIGDIDGYVAALDLVEPQLVVALPDGDGWRLSAPAFFEGPVTKIQALSRDVNDDGMLDLLVLADLKSVNKEYGEFCDAKTEGATTEVIILFGTQQGYRYRWSRLFCGEVPPLEESLSQENVTSWLEEQFTAGKTKDELRYLRTGMWLFPADLFNEDDQLPLASELDALYQQVLDGKDLKHARRQIEYLYDDWDPNTPGTSTYGARLLYLMGLSFEMEGLEEEAADAYLKLIYTAPQSAWAWLAWARLELEPLGLSG